VKPIILVYGCWAEPDRTEGEIAEMITFRWMCEVTREDIIRKEFDKSSVGKKPIL